MKKMSIFLVCLFSSIISYGQFEWVFDNIGLHEYVHQLVKTRKNQYVILHGKTDFCCPKRLTVLDSIGNTLFNFTASGGASSFNISFFKDVIEMPGSTISVATENSVYDSLTMQGFLYSAVLKLDANWTPSLVVENSDQIYDIGASLSDGSYIVLGIEYDQIWRKASDGSDIWEKWLSGYDIFDLATKSNDTILIATGQGLVIMDKDGNLTTGYPSLVFDRIKTNGQDGIIGVKGDSVYLLSPEYALLAAAGYQGDNVRDYSIEGDMIAVLTASGHIYRYDGVLSPLNDFQLFNDGEFIHIAIGAERLVLAGMERYGGFGVTEGTRTVFVKEYSFEGDDYDLSKDVGVVGVEQGAQTEVINLGSSYKVIFKDVKVTVRNFGSHPVESLYLRTQLPKKFDNLGLGPGEEVELTVESIERAFSSDPAGLEISLCIWTSHPDLLMDLDAVNDSYCTDFLVNSEDVLSHNDFKLYPNPAHKMLNLRWQGQIALNDATCRIINAEGKVVKQIEIGHQQGIISIPVEDWPSGVYFVQFFTDNAAFYSGRFVVIK